MHSTNTSNLVYFLSWEVMSPWDQAQCQFWDMYKDAYGFRPRGIDTSTWTLEQLEAEGGSGGLSIEREETARKASECSRNKTG